MVDAYAQAAIYDDEQEALHELRLQGFAAGQIVDLRDRAAVTQVLNQTRQTANTNPKAIREMQWKESFGAWSFAYNKKSNRLQVFG